MPKQNAATDALANEFFMRFARTEYALKEAGFLKDEGGWAKPDWDDFAGKVGNRLWDDPLIKDAIRYMEDNPPKKQVVKDKRLDWKETVRPSDAKALLDCIRTVRNNLFHGGKRFGNMNKPERDEPLMQRSLEILKACLRACPKLEAEYDF
jgi:hypothetical protein